MTKTELHCYFCGSKEAEVNYLIEGDDAYICDLCVDKASIVITKSKTKKSPPKFEFKKPKDIL